MKKNTVSVLVAFVFVVLAGSVLASNNLPQKAKQETIEKIKEKNTPKIDSKKVKIDLTKTEENGYKLSVNGKPFIIKGVIYNPTPVGKGYDYDFFTDENKPWLVDGPLMQELGINCVRIYSVSDDLSKVKLFIRDMYEKYGIFTMVSDWLGLWDYPQSNYADPKFRERSKERIVRIVKELKDEPGLLMWVIGNENNYTFSGKMGYGFWSSPEIEALTSLKERNYKRAEIYYSFVDELAKTIKSIDSERLVSLSNGEASFLDVAAKYCENVDVLSIIMYRGKRFANIFRNVRNVYDKPIFLSEFGCDSYNAYTNESAEDIQGDFLISQWIDIYQNSVLCGNLAGNCLGGVMFEWSDEWWKHNEGFKEGWKVHDTEAGWSEGAYYFDIQAEKNLNMNEEWFGLVSLSTEIENGVNKRIPKKSYYKLKNFLPTCSFPLEDVNK